MQLLTGVQYQYPRSGVLSGVSVNPEGKKGNILIN